MKKVLGKLQPINSFRLPSTLYNITMKVRDAVWFVTHSTH